ncbi:MAG: hypothetical protein GX127_06095 [Eubacteriaceae bacterium]|jgi:hypothetical protein|nr:hypothetical protein [Eubacteriaceae bacterium]
MKNSIKGILGIVIAFALISTGLSGCFNKNQEDKTADTTSEAQLLFADQVGAPLSETIDKINAAGYTGTYIADGVDVTSIIDDVKEDYTTGEIKEDPKNKTAEVTLKPISHIQAEQNEVQSEKLEEDKAWSAVKHHGQGIYGEDFDLDFSTGKTIAKMEGPDTWFLKSYCEVNGKKMICKAKVTGTNENPEIIYFGVY